MQPNVIFFFTDQQRWDSTGLHGNPLGLTPNLDRVARENLHLFHCFTPQPVCCPARACLQTGMYATATNCTRNGRRLPSDIPTLATCFREAGYFTGYIGKWHLSGSDNPKGPVPADRRGGYEYWLGAEALEGISEPYRCIVYDNDEKEVHLPGYRVDALTDAAIDFVAERKDKPFLLFLSLLEPHQQNRLDDFVAPNGYRERYQGRWTPPDLQALGGSSARHLAGYWGMVRRIDEAYGRLMDALVSLGLSENTIVVFTSDHACHFQTRTNEYKRSCHDSSIRVPGVISGPGFKGGGQFEPFVSLIDLMPTLLDAASIPVPEGLHGRSFMPLVRREHSDWPSEVFVQITEKGVGRAVRTSRWKYAVAGKRESETVDQGTLYEECHLYDLECDPYELDNLIGSAGHEAVRVRLRQLLKLKVQEVEELNIEIKPASIDPQTKRRSVTTAEIDL